MVSVKMAVLIAFLRQCDCWSFNDVTISPRLRTGVRPTARGEKTNLQQNEIAENETSEPLDIHERISLIYPGTKWCGAGNVADNYDDLGSAVETDKCCRQHDHCEDIIETGETKHNLTNNAFYTRLNCTCDDTFLQCLRAAARAERAARKVGLLYFDTIDTECFREDFPVVRCRRRGGLMNNKCVEYEYDTSGRPEYQWFDVPEY